MIIKKKIKIWMTGITLSSIHRTFGSGGVHSFLIYSAIHVNESRLHCLMWWYCTSAYNKLVRLLLLMIGSDHQIFWEICKNTWLNVFLFKTVVRDLRAIWPSYFEQVEEQQQRGFPQLKDFDRRELCRCWAYCLVLVTG